MLRPSILLISTLSCALLAQAPLQVGLPEPVPLDLRQGDAALLPPKDARDPAQTEAAREAWRCLLEPLKGALSVRLLLPRDDRRLPLLLAASQALKAENAERRIYLAFDPQAPVLWDPEAWGALQGGALLPTDLESDPGQWRTLLMHAQEQLPGRSWFLWLPSDPGGQAASLMGDGGRLIVPADGPASRLSVQIPAGFIDVEGGIGDLTLRNPSTRESRRWHFTGGEWRPVEPPRDRATVSVVAQGTYDVGALLARMRAEQLRQRTTLRTLEAQADIDLHFQDASSGMGSDLGLRLRYFANAGEPDESLQREVLFNGVKAKLHGKASIPIIEARTSAAMPVALALTERYRYLDAGPGEKPGQRRIRFDPVDGKRELYSGELLVEEASGRILEERSQRSGLPGIVKSETRIVTYGELAPGIWREVRIQGFERWVTPEGVVMVQRRTTLSAFRINDPGFLESRQTARASGETMFQQTLEGTRYFLKQPDGTRKVEEKQKSSGYGVGGFVFIDPTADTPVMPAAGFVYYNFNALDKGIQVNALTAGVFNQAEIGIPNLFWGVDFSTSATLNLLKGTERPVRDGKLQDRDGVGLRSQYAELALARDLGAGFRLSVAGLFQYNQYSEAEEKYRTPGFRLPESGWDRGIQGTLSWQAHGFQLQGSYGKGQEPHATYGTIADPQTVPDEGRYRWWHARTAYDLDLGEGKWLNLAVGNVGGSGFDRFKSLTVSGLGGDTQVGGIRSDAIAADRMFYGKAGFVIPTGPNLRLTLRLDHAQMRSLDDGKYYGFTGLGTVGDFPGFWWFTTVRADLGFGLHSDVPGTRTVNGSLAFLRIF